MLKRLFVSVMGAGVSMLLLGCDSGTGPAGAEHGQDQESTAGHVHEPGDEHPTEGPHGGHLIELGKEEYHAELVHDEATHTVTVHLLDGSGTEPVAADQKEILLQLFQDGEFVDYKLKAEEEPSEFVLVDESLCDTLLHAEEVRGRLQVTISGNPYTGIIEHQAHEHEGHEHDEGADDHAEDAPEGHAHDEDHSG